MTRDYVKFVPLIRCRRPSVGADRSDRMFTE